MKLAAQELEQMLRPEPKKPLRKALETLQGVEAPVASTAKEVYTDLKNVPNAMLTLEEK